MSQDIESCPQCGADDYETHRPHWADGVAPFKPFCECRCGATWDEDRPIAQTAPVQPVAQCANSDTWNCKYCRKTETCEALEDPRNFATPPAAQPALVQEPVAWLFKDDWGRTKIAFSKETANEWGTEVQPLYTTPPAAQPAVPLTDEQIVSMRDNHPWLTERDRPAYLRGVYDAELFHRITKGQE